MRRREFLGVLGGAIAAGPAVAQAQPATLPVLGFLDSRSPEAMTGRLDAFHRGLKEAGFSEGENLKIEYRWANNQLARLSVEAGDLVRRQPSVIVTSGGPSAALAAKAATTTIPIVFLVGEDPARLGLVDSLSRPSGNLTGVNLFANELEAKRLELLHQMVPHAVHVAVLVNSADPTYSETTLREVGAAASRIGLQIRVLRAGTPREISEVFAGIGSQRPDALFVGASAFLNLRRVQLAQLAAFHRLPAAYGFRDSAEAGGLMSYGTSISDTYRQLGGYAGRVLKGAKPADLPVMQATKFEFVINATTAKLLEISVPPALLAIADEVIE
jgi:ABC-type uncharacterized transport system substrate-binding protein